MRFVRLRYIGGYLATILLSIFAILWIRSAGSQLSAPPPEQASVARAAAGHPDTLLHILLALALIIVTARVLGSLFRLINQPAVIGEVVAGILLGPSLLGRIAPEASAYLLPSNVAPFLGSIAQVGVILYMFLVGLELDHALLRGKSHVSVAISHASILLPFILGCLLALLLYPMMSTSDVSFTPFALFMGVSMSITAFPVLARILTERGIQRSRLGAIALACAAVDDVTAWCLLAFVVGVVNSAGTAVLLTVGLTALYIGAVFIVVKPLAMKLVQYRERVGRFTPSMMAIVSVAMLSSALITEYIGIHALFGAFLLGAILPHDSQLGKDLIIRLESLVVVFLLPTFFAFSGLRTQISLVDGLQEWMIVGLIILVASVGKLGGTFVAARISGLDSRDSASLGVLMNTRGLMELIVLNVGLDLGVISRTLFTMMVIMALVTTFATTPILMWISRGRELEGEAEAQPIHS